MVLFSTEGRWGHSEVNCVVEKATNGESAHSSIGMRMTCIAVADDPAAECANCRANKRKQRRRHRQAEDLQYVIPCYILKCGLPEGAWQTAHAGLQEMCGRAQRQRSLQPGARETGGGLLLNLQFADTPPKGRPCSVQRMLHGTDFPWLRCGYQKKRHV